MTNRQILSYTFLVLFLITLFYISSLVSVLRTILSILVYALLTFFIYLSWKLLRKKQPLSFPKYLILFWEKVANMLFLFIVLLWSFAYYQNKINPSQMPLYIITDGKKEIYFQSMVHIGTSDFYDAVAQDIKKAKQDEFVYFFEWVRPWTKESEEKFNKAMGIKFNKELYRSFWKLYGLTFQDNNKFFWLVNNYDFNIDLSLDDIVEFYEQEKKSAKSVNPKWLPSQVGDINTLVVQSLEQLNEKELALLVYVNKSLLNFLIKNDILKEKILNEFGNPYLFEVILHKRNELLAKKILDSQYDKIFITYGLLHFEWVFDILKKQNSNWKIVKTLPKFPIQ